MPFYTSLVDCFDDYGSCVDVLCCPCVQIGRQRNAINAVEDTPDALACCCSYIPCVLCYCAFTVRSGTIAKYRIEERCPMTCCATLLFPMSLCQTSRELTLRGITPGGCLLPPSIATRKM